MQNRSDVYKLFHKLTCIVQALHIPYSKSYTRTTYELWHLHSSWLKSFHECTYRTPAPPPHHAALSISILFFVFLIRLQHWRSQQTLNKTLPWNWYVIRALVIRYAVCIMSDVDQWRIHISHPNCQRESGGRDCGRAHQSEGSPYSVSVNLRVWI